MFNMRGVAGPPVRLSGPAMVAACEKNVKIFGFVRFVLYAIMRQT